MKNNQEINEEYIRKLAKEYFNKSIRAELDSAYIYKYIKDLEDRIYKAIDFINDNASYSEDDKHCVDDLKYDECDDLLKILKGEDNDTRKC